MSDFITLHPLATFGLFVLAFVLLTVVHDIGMALARRIGK